MKKSLSTNQRRQRANNSSEYSERVPVISQRAGNPCPSFTSFTTPTNLCPHSAPEINTFHIMNFKFLVTIIPLILINHPAQVKMRPDPAISLLRLGSSFGKETHRQPPDNTNKNHVWEYHTRSFSQDVPSVVQPYSTDLSLAFSPKFMFLRTFIRKFGWFNNLARMSQLRMVNLLSFYSFTAFNCHALISHIIDKVPGSAGL